MMIQNDGIADGNSLISNNPSGQAATTVERHYHQLIRGFRHKLLRCRMHDGFGIDDSGLHVSLSLTPQDRHHCGSARSS